ncbi:hypothetical protein OAM34_00920 [Alphaproteobacteria bacterium]|jgi:hypothetical protein|nr:hypothetical protein [Alphaproteobacteria bacterium]
MMRDNNPLLDSLKSLRNIATIEALTSKNGIIDDMLLQRLGIDKTYISTLTHLFEEKLIITHHLNQLKLLLREAEIAVLSEKIALKDTNDYKHKDKVSKNHSEPSHVDSLMQDIRQAVSIATGDISSRNSSIKPKTEMHRELASSNSNQTLSDELKQFIEFTLNNLVKDNIGNVVKEIISDKNQETSRVLDLSSASITSKRKSPKKFT